MYVTAPVTVTMIIIAVARDMYFLRGEWKCIVVLVIMLLKIVVFPRLELAFNMSEMF
jgi:hypothetical protein